MFAHSWILSTLLCSFLTAIFAHDEVHRPHWNKYELNQPMRNFRTVFHDSSRDKLYLGGVNALYELNAHNITHEPVERNWKPKQDAMQTCFNFKSDKMLCQNNVGVLQPVNDTHLYTCGTMAYSPVCRYVRKEDFEFEDTIDRGRWKTPYDPYISTVSVIANHTLFTATEDNLQDKQGIISRTLNGVTLRTQANDRYWLYNPVFVGGHHVKHIDSRQDKVMVFFREKAEEFKPYDYGLADNPGTRYSVSRVATVCVNDHGGSLWVLYRKFATFQKMTIVCSNMNGGDESAFRYSHLESTFVLKNDKDPYNPTIYGLFTTPNDAMKGTAVCAYKNSDMMEALMRNQYWDREGDSYKTSYMGDQATRPGTCNDETRNLRQSRLLFGSQHPIKFGIIYPSKRTPFYQEPSTRYKHLVVHKVSKENNSLNENVTVLYMITMEGRLRRVVQVDGDPSRSWPLPDIQAVELAPSECVINMEIGEHDVYVVTNRSITQIPLAACSLYKDCSSCQKARDPYCILNYDETCVSVKKFGPMQREALGLPNVTCHHAKATPTILPEGDHSLIEELKSNLTNLMQRNTEAMQNVQDLTVEKNRKAEAHGSCSQTLQNHVLTIKRLEADVKEVNRSLDSSNLRLTMVRRQLGQCSARSNWLMTRNNQLQEQLISRPTREEHVTTVEKLRNARTIATAAARTCEAEKKNLTIRAAKCFSALKAADYKVKQVNETCQIQKAKAIASLKRELEMLDGNITQLNEKTNKSLGRRGQQNCDYEGWFQFNATGNYFWLGEDRLTWETSKQVCRKLGGSLAIFRSEEELRYVNAIIRAYEPTRSFWIGLVKDVSSYLRWHDGSSMNSNFQNLFPLSQQIRMRSRINYCVEINSFQRWNLVPCNRLRRPLCQKAGASKKTAVVTARTATSTFFRRA